MLCPVRTNTLSFVIMENAGDPTIQLVMKTLREGIKSKYGDYHRQNEKRFPNLEYNTNRVNYEPLAESFREEFYIIRGVDRAKNTIHIPSTKTFAAIFCDEQYVPGKKILNTCRSYAEGASQIVIEGNTSVTEQITTTTIPKKPRNIVLPLSSILLISAIICLVISWLYSTPAASGLVIYRPQKRQLVPRKFFIEGRVLNAETVWIIVRPQKKDEYYFQSPIKVKSDGTWKGEIYVGSTSKESIGLTFEVRAFVKPAGAPESLEVLENTVPTSWPEAELLSSTVEVVRGPDKSN